MTNSFEFDLVFTLPDSSKPDAYALADAVYQAGFDDAVVGTGEHGVVAVSLEAEGDDAELVIVEAARALLRYLPDGCGLREVRPDLVSLADVSARLNIRRQALQKRPMPPVAAHGLYRVTEIFVSLKEQLQKRSGARFSLHGAVGWFSAGYGAQKLNARLALGELDPVSLRVIGEDEGEKVPNRSLVVKDSCKS